MNSSFTSCAEQWRNGEHSPYKQRKSDKTTLGISSQCYLLQTSNDNHKDLRVHYISKVRYELSSLTGDKQAIHSYGFKIIECCG